MIDLFQRVVWIGGGTDSGKTTIADSLARRHHAQVYHFDPHEPDHFDRADPYLHPTLWRIHPDRLSPDERWLARAPDEMAADAIGAWSDRFVLALEDLRALPDDRLIVAEGVGLFPELLAPLLTSPRRAVWLVPSEAFKRASVARRNKLSTVEVSDHERAVANLIARDLIVNEHIRAEASSRRLTVIEVDGSLDLEQMTERVDRLFSSP